MGCNPPFGRMGTSGISAMISFMKARSRASRRASRSVFIRRIYSSVRARMRSFTLADVPRRTDWGEPVRTRFEGLKVRSSSIVTGETLWSSTQVSAKIRKKNSNYLFCALRLKEGQEYAAGFLVEWCIASLRQVVWRPGR